MGGRSPRDDGILGVDRRKALVTVGAALVLAAGTVVLIGRAADFDELSDAARAADEAWFPLCLGGLLCAYTGYVLAYRDVARARGGPCFGPWTVVRVVAIGFGANLVASAAAGLAVDFWALRRAGVGLHESARRVLGLNTLKWAVLALFAACAAAVVLLGRGDAPLAMILAWIAVFVLCLCAAAWVSAPSRADRFTEVDTVARPRRGRGPVAWARWAGAKLRNGLADAIGGVVVARYVVLHPHRYTAGVLGFPLYWFGHLLTLYAGLRAFSGGHVPLAALVLAFATGYAATALPLPGGGSGGIEAALTFSLHAVGVALAPALLGVLLYRLFTFWLPVVPALLLVPGARSLHDELPGTAREAAASAG